MSNILIAYFTWSGNSERLAGQIQQVTAGELFRIAAREPYPASYAMTASRAAKEKHRRSRPELLQYLEGIEAYDTIYLVYPNWWNTVPMAVCTFLERYDFGGKHIMPLCTSGGSGIANSVKEIRALCPGAQVDDGLLIAEQSVGDPAAAERMEQWIGDRA